MISFDTLRSNIHKIKKKKKKIHKKNDRMKMGSLKDLTNNHIKNEGREKSTDKKKSPVQNTSCMR